MKESEDILLFFHNQICVQKLIEHQDPQVHAWKRVERALIFY